MTAYQPKEFDSNQIPSTYTESIANLGSARGKVSEITAAGAIPVDSDQVYISTTGAIAITLADGVEGQEMNIKMLVDGGTATLTPANFQDGTTLAFADVNDSACLVFDGTSWGVIGTTTATVA